MDTGNPRPTALQRPVFEDGLGKRYHAVAPGGEPLEVFELRDELNTGSFEAALRERVTALGRFQNTCFSRVRSVQRLKQNDGRLAIISDRVPGVRLSTVLAVARQQQLPLEINAALCLIRQLVAAVAMLHEKLPGVAHGAIAPERVVITPKSRLVVVDYILGGALEQLEYSPDRYWSDLRVALPLAATASFDQRADVMQIGITALALILGRSLREDEYPGRIDELVACASGSTATGAIEPLQADQRAWLLRMLQRDSQPPFASAVDAWADLERALGSGEHVASFAALEAFVVEYAKKMAAAGPAAPSASPTAPAPVTPTSEPTAPPSAATAAPATELTGAPLPTALPLPALVGEVKPALDAATARSTRPAAAPAISVVPPVPMPGSTPLELTPIGVPTASSAAASTPVRKSSGVMRTADIAHAVSTESHAKSASSPPSSSARTPAPSSASRAAEFSHPQPSDAPTTREILAAADADKNSTSSRGRQRLAAAAVLVLVIASGAWFGRRYFMAPAAAEAPGTLVVVTTPPGVAVIVDGQARGATPLTIEVAAGTHELRLANESAQRVIPFTITPGSTVSQTIEMPKAGPVTGQLTVRSEPSGARVSVDNAPVGTTPLSLDGLVPGPHTVALANDVSSVSQEVVIEAGTTSSLVVPMTAPQGVPVSGWISVTAPVEMQIFEDTRLLGTTQADRLMVSAGRHEFEMVNESLGFRVTRTVTVAPGKVLPIKLELPQGSMALNAQPWAAVWVDGESVGETPIGKVAVPIGTHEVVFRHPQLGEKAVRVTVTATAAARVSVDMTKR